jgi:hypothetical protein
MLCAGLSGDSSNLKGDNIIAENNIILILVLKSYQEPG